LIGILGAQYGIATNEVVAVMRDRASVNNVAIRTLKIVYPNALDEILLEIILSFLICWTF